MPALLTECKLPAREKKPSYLAFRESIEEEDQLYKKIKLTTTITNGTREKLLPNFKAISALNWFLRSTHNTSTKIPVDHCIMSCKIKHNKSEIN